MRPDPLIFGIVIIKNSQRFGFDLVKKGRLRLIFSFGGNKKAQSDHHKTANDHYRLDSPKAHPDLKEVSMRTSLKASTLSVAFCFILAGCTSSYYPVVDLQGVDATKYQQDLTECRGYADQIDTVQDGTIGTLAGAGLGAALGAAVGAIGGDPGTGAALGGTVGTFGGAATGVGNASQRKTTIINNCLTGRGYKVLG